MEIQELIDKLTTLNKDDDIEGNHISADVLLLQYIDNPEVSKAFHDIEKWYE